MWEAAQALPLSVGERKLLEGFARAGSTPQKIALRIRIVLRSADGVANHRLATELGTSRPTILRWRQSQCSTAPCIRTGSQYRGSAPSRMTPPNRP